MRWKKESLWWSAVPNCAAREAFPFRRYPERSAQTKKRATGESPAELASKFRGYRLLFKFFGHNRESELGLCQ